MECIICTEKYFVDKITQKSENKCEYICDSGEKCKHNSLINDDLCNIHIKQRAPITCSACNVSACKICYRKFFLEQFNDPCCLNCNREFDLEFLLGFDGKIQRFKPAFIWGAWKKHREDVLLDRVMARINEYQPIASAEATIDYSKKMSSKIDIRFQKIEDSSQKLCRKRCAYLIIEEDCEERDIKFLHKTELENIEKKIKVLNNRRGPLIASKIIFEKKIRDNRRILNMIERQQIPAENNVVVIDEDETKKEIKKEKYRGKCQTESCNGMIGSDWACGICQTKFCSKCLEIKDKEHECNPDILASIVEIRKNRNAGKTKPCPGCSEEIFRIDGCYQMWCINCHIFFDWGTGEMIKKTTFVHNIHYTEWMLQNRINADETQQCGVGAAILRNRIFPELLDKFMRILLDVNEIRDSITHNVRNEELVNKKLSVKFLKNEIDKTQFKEMIQKNYKANKKEEIVRSILTIYCDTAFQILHNLLEKKHPKIPREICEENLLTNVSLKKTTREALTSTGKIFNSVIKFNYFNE